MVLRRHKTWGWPTIFTPVYQRSALIRLQSCHMVRPWAGAKPRVLGPSIYSLMGFVVTKGPGLSPDPFPQHLNAESLNINSLL